MRLGAECPKALVPLGGRPMLRLTVDSLIESGEIDQVVVAVPAAERDAVTAWLPAAVEVVAGGAERIDSVRAALGAVESAEYVLVHDAARALTPPALIARIVAELRNGSDAVVPVLPLVDTVKAVDPLGRVVGTPDRARLRAVQTPQGFRAELLRRAYAADVGDAVVTDDAGLVERLGVPVHTVDGDPLAFKITTPLDLRLAQALVAG
ncbi:2-C-methyl-D-erythritol 4-phosphate cytidylyltransferase [Skermania piniformis]